MLAVVCAFTMDDTCCFPHAALFSPSSQHSAFFPSISLTLCLAFTCLASLVVGVCHVHANLAISISGYRCQCSVFQISEPDAPDKKEGCYEFGIWKICFLDSASVS